MRPARAAQSIASSTMARKWFNQNNRRADTGTRNSDTDSCSPRASAVRMHRGRGLGAAVDAVEEGIRAALPSDGRFGSMSAVNDGIVGEREQLALDAGDQRFVVAAWEVSSSNRSGEQHVAGEDNAMAHDADAPGRVPGGVPHVKAQTADLQVLAGNQVAVGSGLLLGRGETEPCRLLRNTVIQRAVSRMQAHDRPRPTRDFRHAEHVIDVRVGEPDGHRLGTRLLDLMENQARVLAGIDDGALARLLVDDEKAVLGEHAVGDRDDLHFLPLPSPWCSRRDLRYFSTAIAAVVASPTAVVICRVT